MNSSFDKPFTNNFNWPNYSSVPKPDLPSSYYNNKRYSLDETYNKAVPFMPHELSNQNLLNNVITTTSSMILKSNKIITTTAPHQNTKDDNQTLLLMSKSSDISSLSTLSTESDTEALTTICSSTKDSHFYNDISHHHQKWNQKTPKSNNKKTFLNENQQTKIKSIDYSKNEQENVSNQCYDSCKHESRNAPNIWKRENNDDVVKKKNKTSTEILKTEATNDKLCFGYVSSI